MFARSSALLAAAAALLLAAVLRAGASSAPRGGAGSGSRRAPLAAAWLRRPALPGARRARGRLWRLGAARAEHRQAAPHHAINWLDVAAAPRSVPPSSPAGQAPRAGIAQRRIADGAPRAGIAQRRVADRAPRAGIAQRRPAARAAHPPSTASRRRAARRLRHHAASGTRRPACSGASQPAASRLSAGRCIQQPDCRQRSGQRCALHMGRDARAGLFAHTGFAKTNRDLQLFHCRYKGESDCDDSINRSCAAGIRNAGRFPCKPKLSRSLITRVSLYSIPCTIK